jgi:hypothetical protein
MIIEENYLPRWDEFVLTTCVDLCGERSLIVVNITLSIPMTDDSRLSRTDHECGDIQRHLIASRHNAVKLISLSQTSHNSWSPSHCISTTFFSPLFPSFSHPNATYSYIMIHSKDAAKHTCFSQPWNHSPDRASKQMNFKNPTHLPNPL